MYRFVSKAAGDVWMHDELAKKLLTIMGKEVTPRGIITAAQAPAAIAALRAAVEKEKQRLAGVPPAHPEQGDGNDDGDDEFVSLSQRAFPMIDMLERSAKRKADVLWGV